MLFCLTLCSLLWMQASPIIPFRHFILKDKSSFSLSGRRFVKLRTSVYHRLAVLTLAQSALFHLRCSSVWNSLIKEINGENEKYSSDCHCTNQNWFLKLHIFVCSDDSFMKASLENWLPARGLTGGQALLSILKPAQFSSSGGSGWLLILVRGQSVSVRGDYASALALPWNTSCFRSWLLNILLIFIFLSGTCGWAFLRLDLTVFSGHASSWVPLGAKCSFCWKTIVLTKGWESSPLLAVDVHIDGLWFVLWNQLEILLSS